VALQYIRAHTNASGPGRGCGREGSVKRSAALAMTVPRDSHHTYDTTSNQIHWHWHSTTVIALRLSDDSESLSASERSQLLSFLHEPESYQKEVPMSPCTGIECQCIAACPWQAEALRLLV